MKRRGLAIAVAVAPLMTVALTGCGSKTPEAAAGDQALTVVATTNVYGDIARQIGGEHVEVNEIISSAAQDPHSYEPTAQDKLAISKADIVLANGGGYDQFMDSLVESLPNHDQLELIHAVDGSPVAVEDEHAEEPGHEGESAEEHAAHADEEHAAEDEGHEGHAHAGYNEHVWYDLESMELLGQKLAEKFSAEDTANAQSYEQNAQAFGKELEALKQKLTESGLKGKDFAMTEPVPYHLLTAAGMHDATVEGLSEAVEEGEDISPLVLKQAEEDLASGKIAVLAYNVQTEGPETKKLRAAAEAAKVPVVELTETITDDSSYLTWMGSNIDKLVEAAG
ncbi:metal ABC transporter solute-binding protein, Zn/Mn family [Glutamicibacter sp. PS]|uniref:metal ABC transporter solute-binding protein, Zn/Mn family n=1 Tax=Glutamicibacter sp. PS TaxID=3075634 RepID=UPI0028493755|nr:zinc ABC transporter substrate-binding protein [Glutamicibacter sp. PS]MDR4531941.1 zinc ABC transporter substrate-binding protein [Glutamicibacter sp. PS]